jgi:methylmalonyl-CoA/ethylmalonyl-CoA epimerase
MSFTGLNQFGQISIPVQDLELAVEFYRDSLGMDYLFQVPNMALFNCGGIRILPAVPEGDDPGQHSSIIFFKVADIQAATDALRERGITITSNPHLLAEMPDHNLWMPFFQDPDDKTLVLMSEVTRAEEKCISS